MERQAPKMINKPITLIIKLTYTQAVALIKQLEFKLENLEYGYKDDTKTFSKWKEENEN